MIEHWMMRKIPTLFVGGGLSGSRRARFETHLNRCSRCRHEVHELRRVTERLKADSVPFPTPDAWKEFSGRLHLVLKAEKGEENRPRGSFREVSFLNSRSVWMLPAAAAALLLVLFSAALLMKGPVPPGTDLDWALTDTDTLVAELAGFENDILEEAIGPMSFGLDGWMSLLTDAGDEDMEEINLSLNRSEEKIWGEPDLLEEVLEGMLEEVLS